MNALEYASTHHLISYYSRIEFSLIDNVSHLCKSFLGNNTQLIQ